MQRYVLIQSVDGKTLSSEFTEANLVSAMELRGFKFDGLTGKERLRPELQGQPKFRGIVGPTWGGIRNGQTLVRYESVEVHQRLST